jgi:hypothetical protein
MRVSVRHGCSVDLSIRVGDKGTYEEMRRSQLNNAFQGRCKGDGDGRFVERIAPMTDVSRCRERPQAIRGHRQLRDFYRWSVRCPSELSAYQ